ncbi:MAG: type II secretion system protein N [Ketobacteraceae bacterium]|nr:type II secretion system protein N [Ketobacteraceae bacterium]
MAAETAQANKWIDRGTAAVCAVLVVAICYVIVKTLFLFLDDQYGAQAPRLYGAAVSSSRTSTRNDTVASVDPTAIPLWNLFGKEGARDKPDDTPKDVVAPKTNLQLELHGVFVAPVEENSTAIISEKRRDSKLYQIGDKLPGNATLAAVYENRVLLNRQGRLEALYFPDGENASSLQSSRTSSARAVTSRPPTSRTNRYSANRRGSAGVSGRVEKMIQTASSPAEVARALQEELGVNPNDALREMGLETNNGRGYKITDSGSPIFSAIGGRPGDVILSINGRQLGDPASDLGMAEDLMNNCEPVITMERNGHQFTNKISLCP